jgi:hypothetical protein
MDSIFSVLDVDRSQVDISQAAVSSLNSTCHISDLHHHINTAPPHPHHESVSESPSPHRTAEFYSSNENSTMSTPSTPTPIPNPTTASLVSGLSQTTVTPPVIQAIPIPDGLFTQFSNSSHAHTAIHSTPNRSPSSKRPSKRFTPGMQDRQARGKDPKTGLGSSWKGEDEDGEDEVEAKR